MARPRSRGGEPSSRSISCVRSVRCLVTTLTMQNGAVGLLSRKSAHARACHGLLLFFLHTIRGFRSSGARCRTSCPGSPRSRTCLLLLFIDMCRTSGTYCNRSITLALCPAHMPFPSGVSIFRYCSCPRDDHIKPQKPSPLPCSRGTRECSDDPAVSSC